MEAKKGDARSSNPRFSAPPCGEERRVRERQYTASRQREEGGREGWDELRTRDVLFYDKSHH